MSNKTIIKAKAPAKVILSGEHAVVYGQPALAMAINRYTHAQVSWSTPFHFTFNLLGIDFKQKMTLEALKRLKRQLKKQYQRFHRGHISIREVMKHPVELTLYTAMSVIEKLTHKLPMGIDVDSHSNIPVGCGLGSSAACVVSMITALSHFLELEMDIDDYIRLGIESENLQHGFSSGLDVRISYHGGCLFYENGLFSTRSLPTFPMQWVLSGKPRSSTGECISHAKPFFEKTAIINDFKATTIALDQAIRDNQLIDIHHCVQENHRLLKHIGVVPQQVAEFINHIEQQGGAAKICGAGSLQDGPAGIILVVGDLDIQELCQTFNYELMPIRGDSRGANVF